MKLKYLLGLFTVVGIMYSCTDEDVIQPESIEEVTIGVNLGMSNAIVSKAIVKDNETGEVSYEWATSDELVVNKCFVGIFDSENKLVAYKNATAADLIPQELGENDVNELEETTPSYHITNIQTKTGNGMKLLAIANSEHDLPGNLTTMADFEQLVEDNKTTEFIANNLVKFGVREVDIDPRVNTVYTIPMSQLAAKIVLKVEAFSEEEIDEEVKYYFEGYKYDSNDVLNWFEKNGNSMKEEFKGLLKEIEFRQLSKEEIPLYIWHGGYRIEVKDAGGVKMYSFLNTAYYVKEEVKWYYDVSMLKLLNIETKSETLLNPKALDAALQHRDIVDPNILNITFYTYEKPDNTENPIRIDFEGKLKKGTVKMRQEMVGRWTAIWYKEGDITKPWILPGMPGAGDSQLGPGWGSKGYVLISPENEIAYDPVGEMIPLSNVIEECAESKYALVLAPKSSIEGCNTDGVIHGNIYTVNAVINVERNATPATRSSDIASGVNEGISLSYHYNVSPW